MSECQASTSAQHQCDTCHKTFSKERYLRRHCRLVHVEDQRATCQFCNKQICNIVSLFHTFSIHACSMKFGQIMFFTLVAVNHIEFGNHYTCKFLFLYAQGPRASLDWIYKSVCYRTGMLPFDPLRGPVCNAAASSVL